MSTALDVIQAALEELGVYASGETITDADAARGLWVLNGMLDSWSNESLFCYSITEVTFPLVVGQQRYSIGTGGQINAQRPLRLIDGPGAAYITDYNQNIYPVSVVPQDVWNQIGLRSNTSDIPDTLFYDPQIPLGYINIFPVPLISYNLTFDSYTQLYDMPYLQAPIIFPSGYQDAIQHNLAIRLKPFFKDAQIDPIIIELASQTKAAIKRNNYRPNTAVFDPELISRATPTYNIYRDRTGS
jgi:hypothetical protein